MFIKVNKTSKRFELQFDSSSVDKTLFLKITQRQSYILN